MTSPSSNNYDWATLWANNLLAVEQNPESNQTAGSLVQIDGKIRVVTSKGWTINRIKLSTDEVITKIKEALTNSSTNLTTRQRVTLLAQAKHMMAARKRNESGFFGGLFAWIKGHTTEESEKSLNALVNAETQRMLTDMNTRGVLTPARLTELLKPKNITEAYLLIAEDIEKSRDPTLAKEYLLMGLEAGKKAEQTGRNLYYLGKIYSKLMLFVRSDSTEVRELSEKGIECIKDGEREGVYREFACLVRGSLYENLFNIETDPQKKKAAFDNALREYTESAGLGHGDAAYKLSFFYRNGVTGYLSPDPQKAYGYLLQAAEAGNPEAKKDLGFYHLNKWKDSTLPVDQRVAHLEMGITWLGRSGISRISHEIISDYTPSDTREQSLYSTILQMHDDGTAISGSSSPTQSGVGLAPYRQALLLSNRLLSATGGTPTEQREFLALMQQSANNGNLIVQELLGKYYREGNAQLGIPQNLTESIKWFKLAADQGSPSAQEQLGIIYATREPKNIPQAIVYLTKAAEHGRIEAKIALAQIYYDQNKLNDALNLVEKIRGDDRASLLRGKCLMSGSYWISFSRSGRELITNLAMGPNKEIASEALLFLGDYYLKNDNYDSLAIFDPDFGYPRTALNFYIDAANKGSIEAQKKLGRFYQNGNNISIRQSDQEAAKYYRLAAQKGDAEAQYLLAKLLFSSSQVRDVVEAERLFLAAAQQGHPLAQFEYADFLYSQGKYDKAFYYFENAANQGHLNSEIYLGAMLFAGQGITKNESRALELFKELNAANNADGQMFLAEFYEKGYGGLTIDHAQSVRLKTQAAGRTTWIWNNLRSLLP